MPFLVKAIHVLAVAVAVAADVINRDDILVFFIGCMIKLSCFVYIQFF
jgi:hypothetical protein